MAIIDRRRVLGLLLAAVTLAVPAAGLAQAAADAPAAPGKGTQLTLHVPGMTCPSSCTARVRNALKEVPGVRTVTTDFRKKEAYVTCDQGVGTETLLDALRKAGYEATVSAETPS